MRFTVRLSDSRIKQQVVSGIELSNYIQNSIVLGAAIILDSHPPAKSVISIMCKIKHGSQYCVYIPTQIHALLLKVSKHLHTSRANALRYMLALVDPIKHE